MKDLRGRRQYGPCDSLTERFHQRNMSSVAYNVHYDCTDLCSNRKAVFEILAFLSAATYSNALDRFI